MVIAISGSAVFAAERSEHVTGDARVTLSVSSMQRKAVPKAPTATRVVRGARTTATEALDAVATAALDEANYWSLKTNHEYGGHLCEKGPNSYVFSDPSFSPYTDQVEPSNCAEGLKPVGRYHTHGRDGNINGPSGDDVRVANALTHLTFYVVDRCSSIYSYQGPSAATNVRSLRVRACK